jgi:hypothetical protein
MIQCFWDIFNLYTIDEREQAFGGAAGYSKYYGSLDAFHDTDVGLHEISGAKERLPLLSCIGFMQALITQQNAVLNLGKIFDVELDFGTDPILSRHRLLRHRIAGHPHFESGKVSTFFPSDMRGADWFEVAFYGDEEEKSLVVRVNEFILEHRTALRQYVEQVLLAAEEVEFVMFERSPFETCQNGEVVERGELRWRAFNKNLNKRIGPSKLSITTFTPSLE